MKKTSFSAIQSSYVLITTLVYALIGVTFLDSDNIYGEKKEVSNTNDENYNDKTFISELESASCKSPCPQDAEMCITMCA